jgi:MoaA/NifB/PqqE/SkfB family radical SAM enzyme
MFAYAMKSAHHPILAQLVPTRRCNLACTYCNEFDSYSQLVPTAEMLKRVDQLAALGTAIITLTGGEPLLHPELETVVRHIRARRIIVSVNTNGYLLTPQRIRRLNHAGLDQLQMSIDNVAPDETSKKSLKVLDQKLHWLAEHAEFDVNINCVVGAAVSNPEDALVIARRAAALGFTTTVGVIHDGAGQLRTLTEYERDVIDEIVARRKSKFSFTSVDKFQMNLGRGLPNDWHCGAGSRYLYVCENGLVHWCSQQRGYPGIPLENYTQADLDREYQTVKPCAPFCTISCVHRVAMLDRIREQPLQVIPELLSSTSHGVNTPMSVRFLMRMFLTGTLARVFRNGAVRLLGLK